MTLSKDQITFTLDLFAPLGQVNTRNMMGGLCLYHDEQIFAILDRSGTLFLKAKGEFAATLAATGARQFGADHGGRMGYWTMPEAGLDDPEIASGWARKALTHL